ncbi:restriction endonuclease [Gimesia aquarii]|nr:restriction endonuclease [Gimesia aquarii]
MTDAELTQKLEDLRKLIVDWATERDLWYDSSFTDWVTHFDMEPTQIPCVLVMTYEGPLFEIINGYADSALEDEFTELFDDTGFYFELHDHVTACFYPSNDELIPHYQQFFEWQWICKLVAEDYGDLYEELFEYFQAKPERLRDLHHRDFERLLDSVFRNNGYLSTLGPGSGDGGVDLRLYHKDAIGDVTTLVQAKRYAESRAINLEAVAALSAVVEDERANRGLFVTTSRFLPSAKKFADRQQQRITLATSGDVQRWCNTASTRILRDKSQLVTQSHVSSLLTDHDNEQIVYASWGYNCTLISFAIILKETKNAALLMYLPSKHIDGDGQVGTVVPDTTATSIENLNADNVMRATRSKSEYNDTVYFHADHKLFERWDGNPVYFNSMD